MIKKLSTPFGSFKPAVSQHHSIFLKRSTASLTGVAVKHQATFKSFALAVSLFVALGSHAFGSQPAAKSQNLKDEGFKAVRSADKTLFKRKQEQLAVSFLRDDVVHVQYVPQGQLSGNQTGMVTGGGAKAAVKTTFADKGSFFQLASGALVVQVNKQTGAVSYLKPNGAMLCHEDFATPRQTEKVDIEKVTYNNGNQKVVKTANGDVVKADVAKKEVVASAWKATLNLDCKNGEALYGLGSHQEGFMNLRGTKQYLYQHNLKKSVPVLMSSLGYGLLFDVGSTMIYDDKPAGTQLEMAAVNQIDYYFMYGTELDQVVSHYRDLTGKVQLMPQYLFGYTQSKERYTSDKELDSIVTRFRNTRIPLDIIVQDWNYWKGGLWGHKKFDEKYYPNPSQMIDKLHQKDAHFMLSIWPNVADDEARDMGAKGFVLGRSIYDAFNPEARKMYWNNYVDKNLFSQGVDAWWCDSSEPVDGDWDNQANSIANNPQARYEKNSGPKPAANGWLTLPARALPASSAMAPSSGTATPRPLGPILPTGYHRA